MMIYFGQEFGERGMDNEGFSGRDGRTTIFDYWSVKTIREWLDAGLDIGKLNGEQRDIHAFYKTILNLSIKEKALSKGKFFDLMYVNYDNPGFDSEHVFAYIRKSENEAIFIVANFSQWEQRVETIVPEHAFNFLCLEEGDFIATELVSDKRQEIALHKNKPFSATVPSFSAVLLKLIFDNGKK